MNSDPSGGYVLVELLLLASQSMVDELHRRLAPLGFDDLRPAHGFALARLLPDGATGNDLAEHLGVTKQAASQMIDYLEQRGYVARHPHPRDGRGKLVVLTARGRESLRASGEILADIEQRWAGIIGPGHMAALRADLHRLARDAADDSPPQRLRPVW